MQRAIPSMAAAPIAIETPAGYWERVADHYPQPLSPMHRSIWLPIINSGFKQTSDEFGMLASVEQREIGGWVYMRLAPLGGKDVPRPPAWLMRLLIRVVPAIRTRLKRAVAAIRDDKPGQLLRRWHAEWLPMLIARI